MSGESWAKSVAWGLQRRAPQEEGSPRRGEVLSTGGIGGSRSGVPPEEGSSETILILRFFQRPWKNTVSSIIDFLPPCLGGADPWLSTSD